MAIGTLTPTFRVCTANSCSVIKIYDTTEAYNVDTNTGGWGATNTLTTLITEATLAYTPPSGSESVVDITDTITAVASVTGEFLIAEIAVDPADGEYTFTYTLTVDDVSVDYSLTIYSLCVVRCCVDKLWAKAAKELVTSDCNCTEPTSYSFLAMKAEGLYNSINNSASCGSEDTRDNLLIKLQRICNLENCNCS